MGEGIITRYFATGVMPVTLDSMTRGFNVAKNLTLDSDFHSMGEFEESEVISMM